MTQNQLMLLQRKIEVMEREKGNGPSKKAKKEEPLTETLPPADKEVSDVTLSDCRLDVLLVSVERIHRLQCRA